MSQIDATECPDKITLTDYLLGQLEAPRLDECESHIADCNKCHETLRGLSADDTLTQHVGDAFLHVADSDSVSVAANESQHVRGLVDRLLSETNSHPRQPTPAHADTEILADRAAEVLRCVESDPSQQTLGSIGNYQLIRLLGAGSTGVVFQAIDEKLDRPVALKVLRPSLGSVARERFIAEARLAASIEHPNVVTIYQIDQQERLAYIAMQWLPGQTLEAKLSATTTIVEGDVRRIAGQVAAGLQAAHQRQLVHRDIKPANIWIGDEDEVKILDFGLARIVDDDPGLTATGMLAGTPNFMSPEQTKGHELDGRSDLFSLGCMMYRMATGKFAFGASSILGTLQSIQHEQPTPPKLINAEISADLSDLTMSLLEKQPANRPESAAQVVTMLESERHQWPMRIAGYESVQNESTARPRPARRGFAGRWVAVVAASLLALPCWYFSPQIIRIATDQGELVVESEDEDVKIQILQDGKVVRVLDTKTNNSFNIKSGEYQFAATGDGNSFAMSPKSLTMKRGEKQIVKVTKQIKPSVANNGDAKLQQIVDGIHQKSMAEFERERAALLTQFGAGHPKILRVEKKIEAVKRLLKSTNNHQDAAFEEVDDGVVLDTPFLKKYTITTDLDLAFETLDMMLVDRNVRMKPDAKTGAILVVGREDDHQLVSRALATLSSPEEKDGLSKGLLGVVGTSSESIRETTRQLLAEESVVSRQQPKYKGKPFAHWINITKTERSTEMLCDALQAGAELAETGEQKMDLLEVTRTVARKHGASYHALTRGDTNKLDRDNELVQYYEALIKAINVLDPTEIIQFVLGELEHGTPQSVGFCSCLLDYRSRSNKSVRIIWEDAHNNAFFERAPELLKKVVAQIEEGGSSAENGRALLYYVISTLIGNRTSRLSFASGGERAYVSGVHEENVARAMEKNPTLAPTIRQLFLESSPATQLKLLQLTRAFWPNDEEVELAIQSKLFDPSVFVKYSHGFFGFIVGGKRKTYWDFLSSSPKPFAVQALKKLLDNQLGPEGQRIAVFDSTDEIEGRPATLLYIVKSLATLLKKHPNDTDEDVVPAIDELLQRIVAIEKTDSPTVKQELVDFKTLGIFEEARDLLDEISSTDVSTSGKTKDANAKLPKKAEADTENQLSMIRQLDSKISVELGKDNAIKARFGADAPELSESIATTLLEIRQQIIERLPPKHRSQVNDVVPVPYQAEPPKKKIKGLDSLVFDWTGYDHLKSLIEMGNFESWDGEIMRDSISREKLVARLDENDPKISHVDRRLNAFNTVVNHLKKANGLPVIDLSDAETKSLIKQTAAKGIELTRLLKTYGGNHPTVKNANKSLEELREKLREITYGVNGDD